MLVFELTMPKAASWNGKFSGEGELYALTKTVSDEVLSAQLIENSPYIYKWDDGWTAKIEVFELKNQELQKYKRKVKGFMGYEWMVESLIKYGNIMTEEETKKV